MFFVKKGSIKVSRSECVSIEFLGPSRKAFETGNCLKLKESELKLSETKSVSTGQRQKLKVSEPGSGRTRKTVRISKTYNNLLLV